MVYKLEVFKHVPVKLFAVHFQETWNASTEV